MVVVVENNYIEQHYLEDYSQYFVRCFGEYGRVCSRLHFFQKSDMDAKWLKSVLSSHSCDCQLSELANTRGGVKLGSSVLLRLLNTVDALRAQLAERRGGIPVLTGSILHLLMEWHPEDALGIESVNFQSSADAVNGWLQEKMTSTPSTDVVTVPKEEWDEPQNFELAESVHHMRRVSGNALVGVDGPRRFEEIEKTISVTDNEGEKA